MVSSDTDRNQLCKNRLYSIEDAASIFKCPPSAILEHCLKHQAPIFTAIPDDVTVYGTTVEILDYNDPAISESKRLLLRNQVAFSRPVAVRDIEYLKLGTTDCEKVQQAGECYQGVFREALRFNEDNELIVTRPPEISSNEWGHMDLPLGRRFACYSTRDATLQRSNQSPEFLRKIHLTLNSLRVFGSDLYEHLPRLSTVQGVILFDDGFIEKDYMSRRLVVLNKAAKVYWNPNSPPPNSPTNSNVADWIVHAYSGEPVSEQEEFGKRLAEQFVGVLRKSDKNWNQAEREEKRMKGDLTDFEKLVEVGEAWEGVDLSNPQTYPTMIVDDLVTIYGFDQNLAERAFTLLRPEGARRGGRPKKEIK